MANDILPERCQCDWTFHQGKPCRNEPIDHGNIRVHPALCTPCLFVCCEEREDAVDGEVRLGGRQR
jgi:hypothetical protein